MSHSFLLRIVCIALLPLLAAAASADDNSEMACQCLDDQHLIDLFTVGGRPLNLDPDHKVKILVNHGYVVGYCEERRNPLWSAYVASKLDSGDEPLRYKRPAFFPSDSRVIPAVDGRTFRDGYDRGHMTPNAVIGNQFGSLAQMETFFMTNMCPQKKDLNQKVWAHLETFVRNEVDERDHIYVISGPIFGDAPELVANGPERGIQIPEAFFMILVDTEYEWNTKPKITLLAHRFPQDVASDADYKDRASFGVSVNDVENETKLDFFPQFAELFDDWETREDENPDVHWDSNPD